MSDSGALLPDDEAPSLEAFRRRLEVDGRTEDDLVALTEQLVGPDAAALLRRCAVPHEFDAALLAYLGGLSASEAEVRYLAFIELSMIQLNAESLSLHERWRSRLWQWWLAEQRRAEFAEISERLVEWFTRPANPTGEDSAARRRMFHLLGCRRAEGIEAFVGLFRIARQRRRFSECGLLVRLLREYEPVLSPHERALVDYQEGKLKLDLRQWEDALALLRGVVHAPEADARLRLHAQVRVGHVLRQQGRRDDALQLLESLREQSAHGNEDRSRYRVLYELGEVYRDEGRVDQARGALMEALAIAQRVANDSEVAGLNNSLGTVLLKLRDSGAAIQLFEKALGLLRRAGDAAGIGTVLNNLGLARLECGEWEGAEKTFAESLNLKRQSGDAFGQGKTLLNLSRAQAAQGRLVDAHASAAEAGRVLSDAGYAHESAQARETAAQLQRKADDLTRLANRAPRWRLRIFVLLVIAVLIGIACFAAIFA